MFLTFCRVEKCIFVYWNQSFCCKLTSSTIMNHITFSVVPSVIHEKVKSVLFHLRNGRASIRCQCRKTTVLTCHRCLIKWRTQWHARSSIKLLESSLIMLLESIIVLPENTHCTGITHDNGTQHIRHQCRNTTVLSCHWCLI